MVPWRTDLSKRVSAIRGWFCLVRRAEEILNADVEPAPLAVAWRPQPAGGVISPLRHSIGATNFFRLTFG